MPRVAGEDNIPEWTREAEPLGAKEEPLLGEGDKGSRR